MKRLLFLSVCLMVAMLSFAHDFEVDGIYYNITSSSEPYEVAVTFQGKTYNAYRDEYSGVVTIPTSVTYNSKTYSVTTIGERAFWDCSGLTSVTIPNSVTSIGGYAFYNCTGLEKVIVKDLAAWCNIAFNSYSRFCGDNPLYYAHHLYSDENTEITDLVIPDGVTTIKRYAFYGCSGLNSVTLPESVTSIGSSAFAGCSPFNVPKGSGTKFLSAVDGKGQIFEVDGNEVFAEYLIGAPKITESAVYDVDADGKMEYLNGAALYDKEGNIKQELDASHTDTKKEITTINGSGQLQLYGYYTSSPEELYIDIGGQSGTYCLLQDIGNDGRKDLVEAYSSSDSKFTIHFQQPDGTFKAVEQSATLDEETLTKMKNSGGGGGVVSFGVGMMVKAPKRQTVAADSEVKKVNSATYNTGGYTALDMTDDGILDIMGGSTYTLYSYDDNKYFASYIKRTLFPCDLNGDSELDYIFYDGSNIILQLRTSGTEYEEKTLFTNSNVKKIIFKDFDHDGDIDILAYINDARYTSYETGNTYFVFFRNEGDLSFKRKERNFTLNYDLRDITDVDADGLYELTVYDYTNKKTKVLKVEENLALTEIDITSEIDVVGDFDNDGKVDYRYSNSNKTPYQTWGVFSQAVNTAPQKMEAPTATLNAEAGRLRINWKQGSDKETSSCDLTYELRIGTQPASGDVLFGASLADGTRRSLDVGTMGRSLTILFNANSLKPGKYYISVQAIDGGGRGGAWSDDFVYEHQLANPIIVSNIIDQMTTADTLRLSVKAPIDGAEYKWTVSEGRQVESDGFDTRFVFEHDGEHTVNLAMTYDGRTLNAEPLVIPTVKPLKEISGFDSSHIRPIGYVDLNQDGYPESFCYVNDGHGKMGKVLLSYVSDAPSSVHILDYNMDGYPDVISKSKVYINSGEQDNDFDSETVSFTVKTPYSTTYNIPIDESIIREYNQGEWFDANNDGYPEVFYDGYIYKNDGTNKYWSRDEWKSELCLYDVNRDGFMDKIGKTDQFKWYVMYKDSTANMSYSNPQVLFEIPKELQASIGNSNWVLEDLNNDGYVDLIAKISNEKLIVVKGAATLPCTEAVTVKLPANIVKNCSLKDYNNDGYIDLESYTKSWYGYCFMIQKEGGSLDNFDSHIKNLPPSAPASVAAKQTKDGLLITWSDAQDDHTPAMQMRYNISVKRKGKKGDNSFVISPMNGLKDKATICGTVMYKKSTQMLVPASVLTAGETYEIQVQAIDLWNQHSPMTKAIEFTMTSNGYIDVAEQVATDKETTVKFVGSQAGSYSLNAGDGATIVSDKGNGEYIVKWATEGVKSITLTAGSATVKSSVTVVKPIDLTFTVPATVFAKAPLIIEVSDEMAKAVKNVGLRCSDSNVKVDYVIGSKTANITFPATGTYTLEAYSTDEVKGNTYSQVVNVTAEMPNAAIKQVDVDAATGSYVISWNAEALPAGISKIIVSKEGSKLAQFDEIGTVAATTGRYVDLSSNASVMASRYCIRLVAENGQVSEVSSAHKPLHVMITKAAQGFNLIWNSYEGLDVESYSILRGSTPDNLQEIAQVAGSVNSYTDISAPSGVSYYAVTFATIQPQLARGQKRTKVADETVNSNVISTENAIDAVVAERLEIIVLDEEKELTDDHTDLQLYYMILPTYTTINKVTWEIVDGKDIAAIDANGKLHATGGDGMVVVRVKTIDGSNLTDEIPVNCAVTNQSTGISQISVTTDTDATLKETRYYTIDGKRIESPIAGQMYVECSIYSNGQIVTRKLFKKQ